MWKEGGGGLGGAARGGGCTDGVAFRECELEAIGLIVVYGVVVEDLDVHVPYFEVVGIDKVDALGELLVDLL